MKEYDKNTLLKVAMAGIRVPINETLKAGAPINKARLISLEEGNIRAWFRKTVNWRLKDKKAQVAIEELRPELSTLTDALILDCRKRSTISAINAARAESTIADELSASGYTDYTVIRQKYRIKLVVCMGERKVYLPIKYSSFPEVTEKIVPAIKAIEKIVGEFGKDVKIM